MITSIIAAMGKNRVIGKNNQLLWRLPKELAYFKKATMGHHMIVGRKTFESYPSVLPGRTTLIVTTQKNYQCPENCFTFSSIEKAIDFAKDRKEQELFITGGAEIYKQTIDTVDRMYLTTVDFEQEGDAYFPEFDQEQWKVETVQTCPKGENNPYAWQAKLYIRK